MSLTDQDREELLCDCDRTLMTGAHNSYCGTQDGVNGFVHKDRLTAAVEGIVARHVGAALESVRALADEIATRAPRGAGCGGGRGMSVQQRQ